MPKKEADRLLNALRDLQKAHDRVADSAYDSGGDAYVPVLRTINEAMRDLSQLIGQAAEKAATP